MEVMGEMDIGLKQIIIDSQQDNAFIAEEI
jgi:bifunctional DNase/RNase